MTHTLPRSYSMLRPTNRLNQTLLLLLLTVSPRLPCSIPAPLLGGGHYQPPLLFQIPPVAAVLGRFTVSLHVEATAAPAANLFVVGAHLRHPPLNFFTSPQRFGLSIFDILGCSAPLGVGHDTLWWRQNIVLANQVVSVNHHEKCFCSWIITDNLPPDVVTNMDISSYILRWPSWEHHCQYYRLLSFHVLWSRRGIMRGKCFAGERGKLLFQQTW